jgi:hypothetical protein
MRYFNELSVRYLSCGLKTASLVSTKTYRGVSFCVSGEGFYDTPKTGELHYDLAGIGTPS